MIDINLLHDAAYREHFSEGQSIPQDSDARKMYIVVCGSVGVFNAENDKNEDTLTAGDSFGEQLLFTGTSQQKFRALDAVTVYAIAADTFGAIARTNPMLLYMLLRDAYGLKETPLPAGIERPAAGKQATVPANEIPAAAPQAHAPSNETGKTFKLSPEALKIRESLLQKKDEIKKDASANIQQTSAQSAANIILEKHGAAPALFPPGFRGYAGIEKPEYKKYLFEKEFKCPNCSQAFRGYKVFLSKLVPSSPMRYDLRKRYKGFQAEWYDILTCPHCYFSMLFDYFIEPVRFQKEKIQEALAAAKNETALDFTAERDLDFVFAAHYLALLCSPAFPSKQKQLDLKLWANLSWLYEEAGDEEPERAAALKAAETGEALYMSGNLNKLQEQVVSLQIAGMLYRTGELEKTSRWLFQAKTAKTGKGIYTNLAEDLWEIIRDEKHS
ncbi:DUF2225 domain-containing protein [Christensenella hongkongensis]|uniref:DUF2225 domain-containing protein n=2 Tax=Christensenella hongkongensis TaxID=270498 RepID=A0A0M2NPY0_9FIRM|nr:DUF2225 domain-containing protein [Christensenella hongkongensis]KKI52275.1 DUF2225 domain-containing protein [Christensenella hongkongensis]TCW25611.1 cyclic nucleotide-binding protein [Christensenella hongkongensis]